MSKRRKRRAPTGGPAAKVQQSDEPLVVATRLVCLIGLPVLLLLSPSISYMRPAHLASENNLFPWICVQILATIAGAVWLSAVAFGHVRRLRFTKVDAAVVGFFLVSLVSSMLAAHHFDATRRLKEMLAVLVLYIVIRNVFEGERHQRTLIRVFMGMLGLLAVIGVVHYLWYVFEIKAWNPDGTAVSFLGPNLDPNVAFWEKDFGVRATSITGNPNFLAGSLLVLLPLGLAWLVMHTRPRVPAGPLVATVIWVLVTVVLLAAATDASRSTTAGVAKLRRIQQEGASSRLDPRQVQTELDAAVASTRSLAKWTMAWSAVGVIGLAIALVLWPFYGTAVAVVLGFLLLSFTNSWSGFSGFLVGLGAFALLVYVKKPIRFRPRTAIALGSALGAVVVGFMVIKFAVGSYIIPPKEASTGGRSRLILYDAAPRMIMDRPLLGFGADSFFAYSNKYIAQILPGPSKFEPTLALNPAALLPIPGQDEPAHVTLFPEPAAPDGTVGLLGKGRRLVTERHAQVFINNPGFIRRNPGRVHDEYLAVLIETGAIGFAVFVAIFVLFYIGSLQVWRRGDNSWKSVVVLGSITAVTALVVMQSVDFPLRMPWASCLAMSALALGTTAHRGWSLDLRSRLPLVARVALVVVIAAAGLYLFMTGTRQVRTLELAKDVIRAYDEEAMGVPTDALLEQYKAVAARRPLDHNIYFQLPEMALYLDKLDDETAQAIARLGQIQPYHEKVYYLWGQYYRKKGDFDRAAKAYRRALELEPRMLKARLFLIDCLIKADHLEEADAAIAETWPWQVESEVRLGMARPGSELVKSWAGLALAHSDDFYWSWVINAEATILALRGDFQAADKRWQDAAQRAIRDRSGVGRFAQGAYGIFPDPPIFTLNRGILAKTRPDAVLADQAAWAKRLIGPTEYEQFKRIEDEYIVTLKRGGVIPATGHVTLTPADAARRAERVLEHLVAQYDAQALFSGRNWAREYHNRRGFLDVVMGRSADALKEFELSMATLTPGPEEPTSPPAELRTDVARANILAVKLRMRGEANLPIIDDTAFGEMRFLPWNGLIADPEFRDRVGPDLLRLSANYPHYIPLSLRAALLLHITGHSDQARAVLDTLEKWYPDDDRATTLRSQLRL